MEDYSAIKKDNVVGLEVRILSRISEEMRDNYRAVLLICGMSRTYTHELGKNK